MSLYQGHILRFPYLVCVSSTVLNGTKSDFTRFDFRGFDSGHLLIANGSNPKMDRKWFLTCDGRLWVIPRVGMRRAGWKWFARVYDFTLAEHKVEPARDVSTDELLSLLGSCRSESEFPTTGHLKRFVKRHSGQVFDATLFREFWSAHCPALQSPDLWGEEVVLE